MNPHDVSLWLTVTKPGAMYPSGASDLYTRTVTMGHAPGEGEMVTLWREDEHDGPQWYVKRRWWDFDGRLHLDLSVMVVDPNEQMERSFYNRSVSSQHYSHAWRTDSDGNPGPKLEAAGWRIY